MKYLTLPLFIALFFCTTSVFSQEVGNIEKRDRLSKRELEKEMFFNLLTPEIEKYKNHDLQSLVEYIKLKYKYRIISFVGYGAIQATGLEIMYTPNVVISVEFKNTFSTEEEKNNSVSRMSDKTMLPIAMKQKIKSVDVKIWNYKPDDFPNESKPE
jgi:hypothetical protein